MSKIIKDLRCEFNNSNFKDFVYEGEVEMHENITMEFK